MSLLIFIGLWLSLATGTEAQKPKPCVSPPLMDGTFQLYLADGPVSATGLFAYDAIGNKLRLKTSGTDGNQTFGFDQLMLFNEGVYYNIDWGKLACQKKKLDVTFNPIQVPPESHLLGQAVLGSSSSVGTSLLVNSWGGVMAPDIYYISAFTATGCLPLNYMFTDGLGWSGLNVFNIVLGIKDPMDLLPPFFCPETLQEDQAVPDHFFTAVKSLPRNN